MRLAFVLAATLLSAAGASAQQVLCEAIDRYRECRVASSGIPELKRELSERTCMEGVTWGMASAGVVWVDRGCRAVFSIMNAAPSAATKRVVCESEDGSRKMCDAAVSEGVTLARQLSRTACIEGTTWGKNPAREQLWVDGGCRGEFLVGKTNQTFPPVEALTTLVPCESDGKHRECLADTAAGVQIVRQFDDAKCGFGKEWGYDKKSIWVTKGCRAEFAVRARPKALVKSVVCESASEGRSVCPADTEFGVALVRQLSEGACVLGRSWGFDDGNVWVSDGCKAQFALGGFRLPASAVPATAARVTCASSGDRNVCTVATARGVGLITQTSEQPCVLNRTWGYDADGIWVSDRCAAEFAVAR